MASKEEKLSPEEKLLKVIQGGEEAASADKTAHTVAPAATPAATAAARTRPTAAAAGPAPAAGVPAAASAPAAAAAPAAARGAEKPKLKLAKPEAKPAPVGARPPEPPPEPLPKAAGAEGDLVTDKKAPGVQGIRTANRLLTVVLLVMLGLAIFEIYANATARMPEPKPEAGELFAAAGKVGQHPPLDQILADWQSRPILGNPDQKTITDTKTTEEVKAAVEVTQSLDLIGISAVAGKEGEKEAILVDRTADKMYFLRAGDEVTVGERKLKLRQIETDHAVFLDGTKEITIK